MYWAYINAANQFELDVTDSQALRVRVFSWLKSEEGGIRVVLNLVKVSSIAILSFVAATFLSRLAERLLGRIDGLSSLLREFAVMLVHRGMLAIGVGWALVSMGVSLGPVVALFGGASFVLAFALQSNLGNFASGLMLLVNKPFDVGDEIQIGSHLAFVEAISLVNTTLSDSRGNLISMPNNMVWESDIVNYTHFEHRQLLFTLAVPFEQNLDEIRDMWFAIAQGHPLILDDPAPAFGCPWTAHYDYAITVELQAACLVSEYDTVYLSTLQILQDKMRDRDIKLAPPLLA